MCGDGKAAFRRAEDTRPRTPLELWEASAMKTDNCRKKAKVDDAP